jgi:spore coat protein U-like protein
MRARRLLALSTAAGLALAVSLVAGAATKMATFEVRVTIQSECEITTTTLDFGTLSGLDPVAANLDRQSTLTVTCTPMTPYQIGMDQGNVSGSTVENRLMGAGTATIQFQLYKEATRNNIWGNTPGTGGMNTLGGSGTGSAQTLSVYGRIPSGQPRPPAGAYKSVVTAAIYY